MEKEKKHYQTDRRMLKRNAKAVVRKHYVLLVILCLIAVFYGNEFNYVTSQTDDEYRLITGQEIGGTGFAVRINDKSLLDIAKEKTGGRIENSEAGQKAGELGEKGSEYAEDLKERKEEKARDIKGGSRGALSSLTYFLASGKIVDTLISACSSIAHAETIIHTILIVLSTALTLFLWIFIKNVYIAVLRRMFLEARIYEDVPFSHILHFRAVRRWMNASLSMLRCSVFLALWWLTVIGGVIKFFAYRPIPYIVAENPDLSPKDAMELSERIMDGYKMEAFKLELSFIGWHLLGTLTFGFVDCLWLLPYKTATYAEFYAYVREQAKKNGVEGAELLNDTYLFEKADEEILKDAYRDVEAKQSYIDENTVELTPVRGFFAKNFSLWIGNTDEKAQYDKVDKVRQQIVDARSAEKGELYPERLGPLWAGEEEPVLRDTRAIRTYTVWTVILIFSADMVYSHYVPNVGKGITDYSAYKEKTVSCVERTEEIENYRRI